jgi:hypothetical protein
VLLDVLWLIGLSLGSSSLAVLTIVHLSKNDGKIPENTNLPR